MDEHARGGRRQKQTSTKSSTREVRFTLSHIPFSCFSSRYTPVPDTVLAKGLAATEQTSSVDSHEQRYGGFLTPATGMSTPSVDIKMETIGQARSTLMNVRLTQVSRPSLNERSHWPVVLPGLGQRQWSNRRRSQRLSDRHGLDDS